MERIGTRGDLSRREDPEDAAEYELWGMVSDVSSELERQRMHTVHRAGPEH